jgi:hypothetical protein
VANSAKKASSAKKSTRKKVLSIHQAAESQADEILARRRASRVKRAVALRKYAQRVEAQMNATPRRRGAAATAIERAPLGAAGAVQTAGYLLAVGDSWFSFGRSS